MSTDYLRPKQAADFLGTTEGALAVHRYRGTGPKFLKPSPHRVYYRRADVIEWLEANIRTSTAEDAA